MSGTWSYASTSLSSSQKDQIRLMIGDTSQNDQLMYDEEITFMLSLRPSIYGAAAECCRTIASKFARQVDTVTGELRTLYSARARNYEMRATQYDRMASVAGGALPYAGGISVSDKQAAEQDTDRMAPQFQIGMEDNFIPVAPAGNEALDMPSDNKSGE